MAGCPSSAGVTILLGAEYIQIIFGRYSRIKKSRNIAVAFSPLFSTVFLMSSTRLQALLDQRRPATSERIAVRDGKRGLTYDELDHEVRLVAAAFQRRGIAKGDRVAWFLPNSLEAVLTTLACYKIGAISLPLNYRYTAPEARYVIVYADARMLIFHSNRRGIVEPLLEMSDTIETIVVDAAPDDSRHMSFNELLNGGPMDDQISVTDDDPALILFTSGSTGRPKGVVHSHGGAFAGIDISRRIFDLNERDVVLIGKPISHAGGLQTQLMPALLAGGEAILAMKPNPAEAASLIDQYGVTQYALLASDLLDFIEFLEGHPTKLASLKNSIGSGDAVPHELHHRFRDLFGWEVMEGCGMTEVGGYYAVTPRYGQRKWGSLGLAAPDTRIRIVHENGTDVLDGETGEILVQSPSVTSGYWKVDAATAELLRDAWLHTGDLGRRDEDGYLWFVGRKKLMIVRRGSNIAPAEVEDVLDEHPKVHATVVVGIPDRADGHIPVACIAPLAAEDPPTEEELHEFMIGQIAEYKIPVRFLIMPEFPRNSTGKVDRHRLEEMATAAVKR